MFLRQRNCSVVCDVAKLISKQDYLHLGNFEAILLLKKLAP